MNEREKARKEIQAMYKKAIEDIAASIKAQAKEVGSQDNQVLLCKLVAQWFKDNVKILPASFKVENRGMQGFSLQNSKKETNVHTSFNGLDIASTMPESAVLVGKASPRGAVQTVNDLCAALGIASVAMSGPNVVQSQSTVGQYEQYLKDSRKRVKIEEVENKTPKTITCQAKKRADQLPNNEWNEVYVNGFYFALNVTDPYAEPLSASKVTFPQALLEGKIVQIEKAAEVVSSEPTPENM